MNNNINYGVWAGNRCFIIAEAGVNHNGDLKLAKKLIKAAVDAGADAVKFQMFKANRLAVLSAPKAEYQQLTTKALESQHEMLLQLELSKSNYIELYKYCHEKNILFLSTPFDEKSADFLDSIGMKIFKIPSGEITNKPLIKCIASKNKPLILSTGMSYLNEIKEAIGWIYDASNKRAGKPKLTLLHCVSNYPATFKDVNLMAMKTMEKEFGLPVGYSDHTLGIDVPLAAVALGAKIIEKHFTLDRNMNGPDHKASLEPMELKSMIRAIRNVELSIGDGAKKPAESEKANREVVRKSIVAEKNIKRGELFTAFNISAKRPAYGISPSEWDSVIGKTAKRNFKKDEFIEL